MKECFFHQTLIMRWDDSHFSLLFFESVDVPYCELSNHSTLMEKHKNKLGNNFVFSYLLPGFSLSSLLDKKSKLKVKRYFRVYSLEYEIFISFFYADLTRKRNERWPQFQNKNPFFLMEKIWFFFYFTSVLKRKIAENLFLEHFSFFHSQNWLWFPIIFYFSRIFKFSLFAFLWIFNVFWNIKKSNFFNPIKKSHTKLFFF